MNNYSITIAIQRLRPGAEFVQAGDDLTGLEWLDLVKSRPADVEIEAEVTTVESELTAAAYVNLREIAYNDRGATIEALVVALWERVMESDTTSSDALQIIRDQVKTEFPNLSNP